MAETQFVLRTEDLKKELQVGEVKVKALNGVTITVQRGEFLGIIGPSGSGKSTLLGLIGGLFPAVRAARMPVTDALRAL